jgi:hypothetical protein
MSRKFKEIIDYVKSGILRRERTKEILQVSLIKVMRVISKRIFISKIQ